MEAVEASVSNKTCGAHVKKRRQATLQQHVWVLFLLHILAILSTGGTQKCSVVGGAGNCGGCIAVAAATCRGLTTAPTFSLHSSHTCLLTQVDSFHGVQAACWADSGPKTHDSIHSSQQCTFSCSLLNKPEAKQGSSSSSCCTAHTRFEGLDHNPCHCLRQALPVHFRSSA